MKVTNINVTLGYTANLGDYRSARADVGAGAVLDDGEDIAVAMQGLRDMLAPQLREAVKAAAGIGKPEEAKPTPPEEKKAEPKPAEKKAEPKPAAKKAEPVAEKKAEPATKKADGISEEEHKARQARVLPILRDMGASKASLLVKAEGADLFGNLNPEQLKALESKLDVAPEEPMEVDEF
jgi:outer membrane biosynthesis protein TonB